MRRLILTAVLALLAGPVSGQDEEARPIGASAEYRACTTAAQSMIDERTCLTQEARRARIALSAAIAESDVDAESQVMWERLTEHDCQAEFDLAGGGNSADMRQTACEIEAMADRAAYLARRGRW